MVITGGTGLIGRALALDLARDGHAVVVLSRNPAAAGFASPSITVSAWDGCSLRGWCACLEDVDAVVHLAGENIAAGRWSAARKRRLAESRIVSGQTLVAALAQTIHKPRVFIQASAIGYYPYTTQGERYAENTPPGESFLARLAVQWEASTAPVEQWGVRRVVIRTGIVLSPAGGALPRMILPFAWHVGGRVGDGRQWLAWIHIADEVSAIRFLLEHAEAEGPFNLCAPAPVRNHEFAQILGRVMRRPAYIPTPAFTLRLVLGEMAEMLLKGQRAVPMRLLELGFTFQFPHLEAALADLLTARTVAR